MVHLKPVTMENLDAVLLLKVKDDQKRFVSSTAESLAQAYVCPKTAFLHTLETDDRSAVSGSGLWQSGP